MEDIVTAKELARYLKLTESTIYKLVSRRELPGFKIGGSWRFDLDEILKMIRRAEKKAKRRRQNKANYASQSSLNPTLSPPANLANKKGSGKILRIFQPLEENFV